jgi:hypothetical protein
MEQKDYGARNIKMQTSFVFEEKGPGSDCRQRSHKLPCVMARRKSNGKGIAATGLKSARNDDQERVSDRRRATQRGEDGTVQSRHSCCKGNSIRSDREHKGASFH